MASVANTSVDAEEFGLVLVVGDWLLVLVETADLCVGRGERAKTEGVRGRERTHKEEEERGGKRRGDHRPRGESCGRDPRRKHGLPSPIPVDRDEIRIKIEIEIEIKIENEEGGKPRA